MNKLLKMHHRNFFFHFLILGKVVLFNLSSLKLKFYRPPPPKKIFLKIILLKLIFKAGVKRYVHRGLEYWCKHKYCMSLYF